IRATTCSSLAAPCCCLPCSLRCPAPAHPACCAAMASLRILAFDHEGRPIQFDAWLDDLQLYLLSDSIDNVSLFEHTSGSSLAHPETANSATRSQWLTHDADACLAICNHLPLAEHAHFGQHRTAQALYDAVVTRYSLPATAALGRLLLPYLFPKLYAFATVEDLVAHLRTSNARYRAALPAKFLDRNPPPMYITLYFIVTRLPDSLCAVRDHFLAHDPTALTVDLLEQHLLAAETSVVASPPTPLLLLLTFLVLRMSGLLLLVGSATAARARVAGVVAMAAGVVVGAAVEVVEVEEVVTVVGVVARVGALAVAVVAAVGVAVVAAVGVVVVGLELLSGEVLAMARGSSNSIGARPCRPSSFVSGFLSMGHPGAECPCWAELLMSGVAIFDLDYDASLAAMYALSVSAEGDYYLYVLPDPGIEAAALGASESVLPSTAPAEALHTFTLDSGASHCFFCDSTTLTPLSALVPVRLADPSGVPVLAHSSTVLVSPAVPSSSLSGLHLPLFSKNLVSTAALQDAMVTTTTPKGQCVLICTCTRTGRHLATFTRQPGSSLYTLATEPRQVAASAQVSVSGPVAPPCSCRLLSHQTLLWHHCLGHPSLPRLRAMHSCLLVSSLPRSLPPLLPSPATPCLPCVEGRQSAAPHSSFPPTTAPLQTLHMDSVPSSASGSARTFLSYVCTLTEVVSSPPTSCGTFVVGRGILQSFTLPASHQQNGIAERCIGLVMEVARTSMIHAAAPHFLWPFAVRYTVHQLNLWPRVSLPETSPTLRWMGEVGDASVFWVWGSRAFVRDTFADKLSARAIPCGPSPSGVSQVDPIPGTVLVEVVVDLGAASGGAACGVAEPGGAESEGAKSRGAEPGGAEPGGAEPEGVELGGAESEGAESVGAEPRLSPCSSTTSGFLSLQSGAAGAGDIAAGDTRAGGVGATHLGGAGVTAGAGGTGGAAAAGHGGARTTGTGAARFGSVGGAGAGEAGAGNLAKPEGAGAEGTRAGGTGAGGAGSGGAGAGDTGDIGAGDRGTGTGGARAGGARAGDTGVVDPGARGAGAGGAVSGNTERREPESRLASPVCVVCTGRRVPHLLPPPVPRTHAMALRPSSVPLRIPLPPPPVSSLSAIPDPESDLTRAASTTVSHLLATIVTDPSFESTVASALFGELVDFSAACRLDYATALVAESESTSPPSIGGECALGTAVFEDTQENFECLAAAVPHLVATAMDVKMASWKSTGIYVDAVPPSGANRVDGMWIFRVKRPPRSLPAFKARYITRGFIYGLRQAPLEWHDTLRTTVPALGFTPSIADPSLFLRTDTLVPSFYVIVYVDHLVLQRFSFHFSSPQPAPLSISHSLSAPPLDESVETSGPYPELVGCLITSGMGLVLGGQGPVVLTVHADASWVNDLATQRSSQGYTFSLGSDSVSWRSTCSSFVLSSSCEAEIYTGAMAAQELRWLTYLLIDLGEQPRSPPVLYVDNKAMIAVYQEHRTKHIALPYFLPRVNTTDIFTKALQSGDHQRFSNVLGIVRTLPHLLTM
ncbi:unnamed protein product, partial [Closterium sp. NIES-54]